MRKRYPLRTNTSFAVSRTQPKFEPYPSTAVQVDDALKQALGLTSLGMTTYLQQAIVSGVFLICLNEPCRFEIAREFLEEGYCHKVAITIMTVVGA